MRKIAIGAMMLAGTMLGACQDGLPPGQVGSPPPNLTPRQDVYNSATLDTVPRAVKTAFQLDYPRVIVSSAEQVKTANGPLLYKIVYIRDGVPHEVQYTAEGAMVAAPPQPSDMNMRRPGYPATAPSGANAPAR